MLIHIGDTCEQTPRIYECLGDPGIQASSPLRSLPRQSIREQLCEDTSSFVIEKAAPSAVFRTSSQDGVLRLLCTQEANETQEPAKTNFWSTFSNLGSQLTPTKNISEPTSRAPKSLGHVERKCKFVTCGVCLCFSSTNPEFELYLM